MYEVALPSACAQHNLVSQAAGTDKAPLAATQAVKPKIAAPAGTAASQRDGQSKEQPQDAASSNTGKTVFVRSLPADVSKDQLYLAFKKFGGLRACRLVLVSKAAAVAPSPACCSTCCLMLVYCM